MARASEGRLCHGMGALRGCCHNAVGRDRDGWAVRSKAALLLVLVAKKQGLLAVQELLPQLLNAAKESSTHTEMVSRM